MKKWIGLGCLMLLSGWVLASPTKPNKEGDPLLAPGPYTATVPAFVCGGCPEWIQTKLGAVKSLKNVTVDHKTREVTFTVKKGAKVKRSDIQNVLDAAAREMGMGADYTLRDFKEGEPIKK
jgi:hypothetical protein